MSARDAFRPIYYLGCKTEFAQAIAYAIDEVDPSRGRLGDLFAGTGAVAAALSTTREVLTTDIQEYSRVLCSAVLNPYKASSREIHAFVERAKRSDIYHQLNWCFEPLIIYEEECVSDAESGKPANLVSLLEAQPIAASNGASLECGAFDNARSEVADRLKRRALWGTRPSTVSTMFGGIYFSYLQAICLDALLVESELAAMPSDFVLAAVLSTASSLVNTVGKQFAQPIRPRNKAGVVKPNLVKVVKRDRTLDAFAVFTLWLHKYAALQKRSKSPIALREDYLGAIETHSSELSVLYADPPYTRDHYSRFYHVLETMCLRDAPTFATVKKGGLTQVSRGVYRQDRHQSPFCIRSQAPGAFDALFKAARAQDLPMVLSYSPHESGDGTHPRVVSTAQIEEIANSHYSRVVIEAIDGSAHNKLNRADLRLRTRENAEILIKCYR